MRVLLQAVKAGTSAPRDSFNPKLETIRPQAKPSDNIFRYVLSDMHVTGRKCPAATDRPTDWPNQL